MKNYEKPVVLRSEELAEGVYLASGAPGMDIDGGAGAGCFNYVSYSGGDLSTSDLFYEYNVLFKHIDVAHMECTHKIIIYFSQTPVDADCITNCSNAVISGNSITVTWAQAQANGGGEYADIGVKVKWAGDVKGVPTGGYGWVE